MQSRVFAASLLALKVLAEADVFTDLTITPQSAAATNGWPRTSYWKGDVKWHIDGGQLAAGTEFTLHMPYVQASASTVNLVANGVTYANCNFFNGDFIVGYSELQCKVAPGLTDSDVAVGTLTIPFLFDSGFSSTTPSLQAAKQWSVGTNTVTWTSGSKSLSSTVTFQGGTDTFDPDTHVHSAQTLFGLNKQQYYVRGASCPSGDQSGTLGINFYNAGSPPIDCSSLTTAISNQFNAWYFPETASAFTYSVLCNNSVAEITYSGVPAGYHPFFDILTPLAQVGTLNFAHIQSYKCGDGPTQQASHLSTFTTLPGGNTGSEGSNIVNTIVTKTYTGLTTRITTLPYDSTESGATRTIEVDVPVPTVSTTKTWTGSFTTTSTITRGEGESNTIVVDYPTPTVSTTKTWTGSYTTTSTITGGEGESNTVVVNDPTPTTTITTTWTGTVTSTITIPGGPGESVTIVVEVPPTGTSMSASSAPLSFSVISVSSAGPSSSASSSFASFSNSSVPALSSPGLSTSSVVSLTSDSVTPTSNVPSVVPTDGPSSSTGETSLTICRRDGSDCITIDSSSVYSPPTSTPNGENGTPTHTNTVTWTSTKTQVPGGPTSTPTNGENGGSNNGSPGNGKPGIGESGNGSGNGGSGNGSGNSGSGNGSGNNGSENGGPGNSSGTDDSGHGSGNGSGNGGSVNESGNSHGSGSGSGSDGSATGTGNDHGSGSGTDSGASPTVFEGSATLSSASWSLLSFFMSVIVFFNM